MSWIILILLVGLVVCITGCFYDLSKHMAELSKSQEKYKDKL